MGIYLVQRFHCGDSGRNRELSRIIKHFRTFSKNKTTQTRSYREWSRILKWVCWCNFGVRCKLDTPSCPPKKHISHSNIAALYTKTPRKSSNIIVEFCPSTWEKPFCIAQYPLDCLKECICFSTEIYFWFYPPTQADYCLKPHSTLFRSFCIGAL